MSGVDWEIGGRPSSLGQGAAALPLTSLKLEPFQLLVVLPGEEAEEDRDEVILHPEEGGARHQGGRDQPDEMDILALRNQFGGHLSTVEREDRQ